MLKKTLILLVLAAVVSIGSTAQAFWISDPTTASGQNFRPALDESPYITVYGSQSLQKLQFRSGIFLNYSRKPLEIGAVGPTINTTIRDLGWADIFFTLGLTDWLQVGMDIPVAGYETFLRRDVRSPNVETVYGLGDVELEFKLRLLDIAKYNVGLSLKPFVTVPTGNGNKFMGNNSFTGGATLIADFDIADRVQLALNMGYLARDNYLISGRNIRIDDQLLYGLGMNIKLIERLHFTTEVYGSTVLADFADFDKKRQLPMEVIGGLKFFPIETLTVTVGGGGGITNGYGTPIFRGFIGLAYTRPRQVELAPAPKPEPLAYIEEEHIVIKRKVHFEFGKTVIRDVSFPILNAVIEVLNQNPHVKKVQVEGHTDAIGSAANNQRLSQKRADAVAEWLINHGLSPDRVVAKGMGEEQPIDTNDTAIGRAKNRRVAFTILNQD